MPSVGRSSRWQWLGRTSGSSSRFQNRWRGKKRGFSKEERDPGKEKEARVKNKPKKTDWSVFRKKAAEARTKRGEASLSEVRTRRQGDTKRKSRIKKRMRFGRQRFE